MESFNIKDHVRGDFGTCSVPSTRKCYQILDLQSKATAVFMDQTSPLLVLQPRRHGQLERLADNLTESVRFDERIMSKTKPKKEAEVGG